MPLKKMSDRVMKEDMEGRKLVAFLEERFIQSESCIRTDEVN